MNHNTEHRLRSARKGYHGSKEQGSLVNYGPGQYTGSKRRSVILSTSRDSHPVSHHGVLTIKVATAPAPVRAAQTEKPEL